VHDNYKLASSGWIWTPKARLCERVP
jgi:hypothetical protein